MGEITQIFILCSLQIQPMLAFVPARTPPPAVKAPNSPDALGFPSWLQALTLCRVSPSSGHHQTRKPWQHTGRSPQMSERLRLFQQVRDQASAVQNWNESTNGDNDQRPARQLTALVLHNDSPHFPRTAAVREQRARTPPHV